VKPSNALTPEEVAAVIGAHVVVGSMIEEWRALRAELRAVEEAEHPPFHDKFGRLWAWKSGDLWTHDSTLALTRGMIDDFRRLPPEKLRNNPNYWQLCDICRSQWSDKSPVSPRCRLSEGWYDVRDGKTYPTQEEVECFHVLTTVKPGAYSGCVSYTERRT
jgi:hypothetical protein